MKNILIIESTRDNLGISYAFLKDVYDIPDLNLRNAVIDSINGVVQYNDNISTEKYKIITTNYGYYFNSLSTTTPPFTVEYIIEHIF